MRKVRQESTTMSASRLRYAAAATGRYLKRLWRADPWMCAIDLALLAFGIACWTALLLGAGWFTR